MEESLAKINAENYHFIERVLTRFKNEQIGYNEAIHCIQRNYEEQIVRKFNVNFCEHDFRYSHIEYPSIGTYSAIPPNKEVVICRKCGMIIKTNQV